MRSLLSVILGYFLFGASTVLLFRLTGRDPRVAQDTSFTVIATSAGALFAALAGYTTAAIAGRREVRHALALALLLALVAAASAFAQRGRASMWTELAVILVIAPCAILGGWARARQLGRP